MAYAPTVSREAQLMDILGIEELQQDEQETLLLDLGELIFKGSMLRMMENMEEVVKERFELLLVSDPSDDDLQAFLAEQVPGADQAFADTIEELTSDILAITGDSQD